MCLVTLIDFIKNRKKAVKEMCFHQTLTGLPEICSKNLNQAPCIICNTEKITTLPKGKTVYTSNLWPRELINMDFEFYNATSIRGLTSMLTVFRAKTRMLGLLTTEYKLAPICIICFILTTLNNKQHPCKRMSISEYGDLANSTDVRNLLLLVVMNYVSM